MVLVHPSVLPPVGTGQRRWNNVKKKKRLSRLLSRKQALFDFVLEADR
jgi:hypothetical protein